MERKQINTKTAGDSGYVAFYKGRECEVFAASSYAAQLKAATHFKARKSYDVAVVVAERPDGATVTHTPDF